MLVMFVGSSMLNWLDPPDEIFILGQFAITIFAAFAVYVIFSASRSMYFREAENNDGDG